MNVVFKTGDVVFHPTYGEGVVSPFPSCVPNGCVVHFERIKQEWECHEKLLSFSPWPAPNHVRPFEPGWWLAKIGNEFDVRWRLDEEFHTINPCLHGDKFRVGINRKWIKPMGHNPKAPDF